MEERQRGTTHVAYIVTCRGHRIEPGGCFCTRRYDHRTEIPAVTAEAPKAPAVKADEPKSPAVTAPAATVAGDKAATPVKPVKAVNKVKKSTTAAKATSKPATEEVKPAAPKADTHL